MSQRYQAPTVRKAFQILRLISQSDRGLRISELSKDLGISKSTVHGITSALEELGAIKRDPLTKKYTLGFTLFELGRLAYSLTDLKDLAGPVMERLMDRTQTSVFLGVLNWEHVTILDVVESRQDLKITAPIGTTIPLLAGAVGKVFLASMGDETIREIITEKGLKRYTENTIIDPDQYLREIKLVGKQGYATDYEEYILGVRAVASPIKVGGHMMSAIWTVGFRAILDEDNMKILIKETKEAAQAITRRIKKTPLV